MFSLKDESVIIWLSKIELFFIYLMTISVSYIFKLIFSFILSFFCNNLYKLHMHTNTNIYYLFVGSHSLQKYSSFTFGLSSSALY